MRTLTLLAVILYRPNPAPAYSVLTHEAIIDSAWEQDIRPLLRQRFPGSTEDGLLKAYAYAYGGCIVQDMGYYPFGSRFFSDLTHYVRSGDFVEALLRDARDVNEFAFALGALAHYTSDTTGHPVAVNRSVPILYPKLRRKYGDVVTYFQNPGAHMKAEFGFDVVQVARGSYAPQAYHDFIGFEVAEDLLKRSFFDTYSIKLDDLFPNLDLALGTYRYTAGTLIPEATKVAWELKADKLVQARPDLTKEKFVYRLSRGGYRKEWGPKYRKPGIGSKILAFFMRILPKFGPFKSVTFAPPTPATEKMFVASFDQTLDRYRESLRNLRARRMALKNLDLDTGEPTRKGEYALADKTYEHLLKKFSKRHFQDISPALSANVLAFYGAQSATDLARLPRTH